MDVFIQIGSVLMKKTNEIISISVYINEKKLYIRINQRGEDIVFELCIDNDKDSNLVDIKRHKKREHSMVEGLQDYKILDDHETTELIGYIIITNKSFIKHPDCDLKESAKKIIIEIFKHAFYSRLNFKGWKIQKNNRLLLEVEGIDVRNLTSNKKTSGKDFKAEYIIDKNIIPIDEDNSCSKTSNKNMCHNCIERKDCIESIMRKTDCEFYRPGPTKGAPKWW